MTDNNLAPGRTDRHFNARLAEAGLELPADICAEVYRAALALRNAADLLLAYLPPDSTAAHDAAQNFEEN